MTSTWVKGKGAPTMTSLKAQKPSLRERLRMFVMFYLSPPNPCEQCPRGVTPKYKKERFNYILYCPICGYRKEGFDFGLIIRRWNHQAATEKARKALKGLEGSNPGFKAAKRIEADDGY